MAKSAEIICAQIVLNRLQCIALDDIIVLNRLQCIALDDIIVLNRLQCIALDDIRSTTNVAIRVDDGRLPSMPSRVKASLQHKIWRPPFRCRRSNSMKWRTC